jgi:hypothetical protein
MLVNQQDQKASLYAFKMLPEAVMLVNQQDQKACLYRLYDAFKVSVCVQLLQQAIMCANQRHQTCLYVFHCCDKQSCLQHQ